MNKADYIFEKLAKAKSKKKKKPSLKYKGKYHIFSKKISKKDRAKKSVASGVRTGVLSGALTGALNSGPGKWKSAGKFGLMLAPFGAAAQYALGPRNKLVYVKTNRT